jgi:methionine-rich copper-binding protein CopC
LHQRNSIRLAFAGALAAVAAFTLVSTAWGHAHVDTSSPSKGQILQSPPTQVVLTFVEEIQKTAGSYGLEVTKDGGGSVTSGSPVIDPANAAKLSVALQPNLTAGRYVVNWHNVSAADGDAAEGAFSFYVSTAPSAADLAKDKDLEMIGAEEEMTPTAEATAAPATAPTSVQQPTVIAPAGGAALPRTGTGSSQGGATLLWLGLAGIMAAAGLGTTVVARTLRRG